MRKGRLGLTLLTGLAVIVAACNGGAASPAPAEYKACQVSDTGGIDDKSFNQNAWEGMQRAEDELGIEIKFLESEREEDYARNLTQFLDEGCDIIVTVGFLLGDATADAANANPNTRFAIVDFAYDPALPNVEGLVFATAEAAMLVGYASASWTKTGVMGTFGGINIGGPVTDFMDGFVAGANYHNAQKGTSVRVLGWNPVTKEGSFTGDFSSVDNGKNLAAGMLQERADVVLGVGGPIGQGIFAAIEEANATAVGIGVDVDWTESVPQYKSLTLTSVLKRIDNAVFSAIQRAMNNDPVGAVFVSTLANDGVGIAPFHDYDSQISADTKAEIEALRLAIIDGSVKVEEYFAP